MVSQNPSAETGQPSPGITALDTRREALMRKRDPWMTIWRENADYVMPRRAPALSGSLEPNTDSEDNLFDTTAIQANMTLANGQLAWMSPQESAWFAFSPPDGVEDDEARVWLSEATERTRLHLARSNFYNVIHEYYLDRGGFGTACMYCEGDETGQLSFRVWTIGTFCIDVDHNGQVDVVFREFKLTARQALQKFGEGNVSGDILKCIEDGKGHEDFEFIHAIYPRADAERDFSKIDGENMPIASVYYEKKAKKQNRMSGYEEMPAFVSRYLEWGTGTGDLYGWCPAMAAVPDARQLNFLQEMGDAMAEKKAFPPILAPSELDGEIDIEAGGITYHPQSFSRDAEFLPREWNVAGDYNILNDRVELRQQSIKDHFHVDLFQMFAELDKQMTAREVAARSQERLIQFSPTFARLTTELFEPLLARVFGILLRTGALGTPPESLMIVDQASQSAEVPVPKIEYNSRIAMALRALPSIAILDTFENLHGMSELLPELVDNFNWDDAIRDSALNQGFPAEHIRPMHEVKDIRAARQEQQMQMQQLQIAAEAAEAASKLGNVPPDSQVGEMIEGQFSEQEEPIPQAI